MPQHSLGFATGRLERITDHLMRNYIEPGKIVGCQVLVARGGEVAYFRSLGLRDRERGLPMTDDTIFRIYSMTKPITSVALMTLFEQGYFQLTDPVHRFVPDWREPRVWVSGEGAQMQTAPAKRPITFRDLLSHTGGLTYGGDLPSVGLEHPVDRIYQELRLRSFDGTDNMAVFLGKLASVPLIAHPGERFMYSLSTDACGALVEVISGQRFDRYLQQHIFEPLGMKDTAFFVAPEKLPRFAANYRRRADRTLKLIDDPGDSQFAREPRFFSGGGGLTSTTADYLRFCEMLRRGGELDGQRVLGPRTIELMHRNHLPGGKMLADLAVGKYAESPMQGVGFGLGFATTIDPLAGGVLGGGEYYWGGAASTIFWIDPKEDLIVIFMTQLMPSATFDFRGQLRNLVYSALV
jgi:CubicO group peptidase (beta-lactamase class C family)